MASDPALVCVSVVWSFQNDYKRPSAAIETVFVNDTRESVMVQTALFVADELAGTRTPGDTKIQDRRVDRRPAIRAALAYAENPSDEAEQRFIDAYGDVQESEDDGHATPDGLHWDIYVVETNARKTDVSKIKEALQEADRVMDSGADGADGAASGAKRAR